MLPNTEELIAFIESEDVNCMEERFSLVKARDAYGVYTGTYPFP